MKKWILTILALAVLALACSAAAAEGSLFADIERDTDSPEWVANLPAAQEANRGRGTAFHPAKQGIRIGKTLDFTAKGQQAFLDVCSDHFRQNTPYVRRSI